MIPTQPSVPNPFEITNNPGTGNMFKCYGCGQWIGNMQYHNCPGPGWNPVRTVPYVPTIHPDVSSGGMISELMMYSDFKKLIKRDTLAKFRETFYSYLSGLAEETEKQGSVPGFGLDAIFDVFDDVAEEFHDDNSV